MNPYFPALVFLTLIGQVLVAHTAPQTPTTVADGEKYTHMVGKLDECKAQVAAIQDQQCNVIFLGDSITEGWLHAGKELWEQNYVPLHALNFGVTGDKTQQLLWRMENLGIANLKPKVAVIMIGTNNTDSTPEQIAEGIHAVIAKTRNMYPGIKMILMSLTPNLRANEKMMAVDAIIRHFENDKDLFYLDLVPLMTSTIVTTPEGKTEQSWRGISSDHLHPDATGYQIWMQALNPMLSKLLQETEIGIK
jgi:lysophospholipase L1-like esterase